METQLNSLLDKLTLQLGDTGLIIQAKAMQFHTKSQISENECERLLDLLGLKDVVSNELKKLKLMSVLYYLQAEFAPEKVVNFYSKYESWHNTVKNMRSSCNLDHLQLIYNLIEYEDKFKLLNAERIKFIGMQMSSYDKLEKPFEDYVLFKYYNGLIKYLLGDYQSASISVMDIVIDLNEEISNKNDRTSFIDYIELKNAILTLKILEKQYEVKAALSNLESLYDNYSKKDEALSVKFAFKMCDIYLSGYEYDKGFILLSQIFKKIKKQMYFGNKKFPEFVEICLNTICRLILCSIMLGRSEDTNNFTRKLGKILYYLKDYDAKTPAEIEMRDLLIAKYQFYYTITKLISKYSIISKSEINFAIGEYRNKYKNVILSEDEVIINIYSINSSDLLAKNFFDKITLNMSIIQNNKFTQVNYVPLFFSIYNQISILTKNVASDTNVKKQFEYVERIRSCTKSVAEYIAKYIDNSEIKIIFSYPYFKEVLIKIFFAHIFTFYFTRDYKKGLEQFADVETIRDKLDLTGGCMKQYGELLKIKGDLFFKLEDYAKSAVEYSRVVKINEEYNNHPHLALSQFNLGLSHIYCKEYELSKKNLQLSLNNFQAMTVNNPGKFNDKITQINSLVDSLNTSIFS